MQISIMTKPINREAQRICLRNMKILDSNKLDNPKVKKLIQLPTKSHTPDHLGVALNSNIRSHLVEFLYNCFDKTHNSGVLSCPFL